LLAILADPSHPQHAERVEEFGDEFDPDEFVLDVTNAALASRFRMKIAAAR
jgi:hypothetical protein